MRRSLGPRRARLAGIVALAVSIGCGDPAGPVLPKLEILVAAGDDQYGGRGQVLPARLHATVVVAATGEPRKDVTVLWQVEEGDASFVTASANVTDSTGSAYQSLRLGSTAGDVVVRVSAVEQSAATTTFTLHAIDDPVVTGLSASEARGGDTISIQGLNFLPDVARNAVLFSGIRGRVLAAAADRLTVEVPPCLPSRVVDVSVAIGSVSSDAVELAVSDAGNVTQLDPGEVLDVPDPGAPGCLRLAGDGKQYLALAYSSARIGSAVHPATFVGLTSWSGAAPSRADAGALAPSGVAEALEPGTQEAWDLSLRRREAELLKEVRGARTAPALVQVAAAVPALGEARTFNVYNADGDFDEVGAVVRYVGERAVLYEDTLAPSGGFTDSDLAAFSATFDEMIHPTVTGAFGAASDLDGNERIVILFTPTVNALSPRGSDGFVGGFFYGLDLLIDREGSNQGEVFYALVPDPTGDFSDPHPTSQVLEVTPAVLAHEFQHMVHFNQRILVGEAPGAEALWLSEGMAQMAEELVARAYGSGPEADAFRQGNLARARRYVLDPGAVSLIVTTGQGSLEERGAGWLHTLYLTERFGVDVLGRLAASALTGVDNVVNETKLPWNQLFRDWLSALYLHGRGDYGPELAFGSVPLRTSLQRSDGSDGLQPIVVGQADVRHDLDLLSASAGYYIVRPPVGGSMVVRVGGPGGGASPSGAELGLRIVRLF